MFSVQAYQWNIRHKAVLKNNIIHTSDCKQQEINILHSFVPCAVVKSFWDDVKTWFCHVSSLTLVLTAESILLGELSTSPCDFAKSFK